MLSFHQDSIEEKNNSKEKLASFGIDVDVSTGMIQYNTIQNTNLLKCNAVYLLRHGHTKGTQEHVFMSDTSDNAHVCEKGKEDILKLKDCCEKYKFDCVVVCSDIPRVLETAEIFKSVNPTKKYYYKKNFKGINNKGWEGKKEETFNEQDLSDYNERELKHNIFAKSSEGESWSQVLLNCIDLIEYLNSEHKNERVLLIGQGSIIRGINIIIHKYANPWENYNVKKLYNFEKKNNEDNYGTISCIIDREVKN